MSGNEMHPSYQPLMSSDFPFPLAEPRPEPMQVVRPCGCRFMELVPGDPLAQVSWCVSHDPGYEPPGQARAIPGSEILTSGPSLVELDAGETGEQCVHCLRFTYEPCVRCGRGLASDEVERYDDD